jgi:hypothetical protein
VVLRRAHSFFHLRLGVHSRAQDSQTTSEWTLDYPPFFAFFERFLSTFAYIVDPKIVDVNNLEYNATSVVAFQRITVIVSELVLVFGLFRCVFLFLSLSAC